jgi:phosphoribosylaminoimidazolecarboxamide formyltransferase/IMP cyclohydrolase
MAKTAKEKAAGSVSTGSVTIRRALLSVSDKTGIEELARFLHENKVEIIATGGTMSYLKSRQIPAISVMAMTGYPEILDGRVKTLHPKVFGGILYRRGEPSHEAALVEHSIRSIDLIVINLYPFEQVTASKDCGDFEAVENIDIGGPSMIRAAAKNYESVAVLTDPVDYSEFIDRFTRGKGTLDGETRRRWAAKAFARTANYDAAIAGFMEKGCDAPGEAPSLRISAFKRQKTLRYGENPHQRGALYKKIGGNTLSLTDAEVLAGKELSYNNYFDLECALSIVTDFRTRPFAVVIKHATPCGAAEADDLATAYQAAHDTDPMSAYGGIIGLNRKVDMATAEKIARTLFVECVLAPGYDDDAFTLLKKKKTRRFLQLSGIEAPPQNPDWVYRVLAGGLLAQSPDVIEVGQDDLQAVTRTKPTPGQIAALLFGRRLVKHVRSNAIVLIQGTAAVGIGGGQTSRIDAVKMSIEKAGDRAAGSVLASDAFFPMPDNIEVAAAAGIAAIIQPGGSKKDPEVIAAADEHGIAMVFSGIRNFRH